jgi:hypothetical protein
MEKQIIYALVKPPSKIICVCKEKDCSKEELIQTCSEKGLLLYQSHLLSENNPAQPWSLVWDSVGLKKPDKQQVRAVVEEPADSGLFCPYCNKKFSSESGRTLHIKAKHSDEER